VLKSNQPIGIFDSGIGGLTVAEAIHKLLPQENIIYFGDTAHTPWGNQSATAIQYYASRISQTLLDHNCKTIVIACNTASATAFDAVQRIVKDHSILFNVIDPVIEYLVSTHRGKNVGLIGTKQTIKSQAYLSRLTKHTDDINLQALATPLLAPLIEEGFSNTTSANEIIDHYLSNSALQNIAALILGCTHYPLIKQQVANFFGAKVDVIDSAELMAQVVEKELKNRDLLNIGNQGQCTFYVSHDSEFFNLTAKQLFPGDIKLQTYPLWE
jgi:glutamate racemase